MMLKKYKILMLIIILSLIGIITVISIWLFASYRSRLDFVTSEVERGLFNSLQQYYVKNEDQIAQNQKGFLKRSDFLNAYSALKNVYPAIDSVRVTRIIDSVLIEKRGYFGNRERGQYSTNSNRSIVSSFFLQKIDFNDSVLGSLDRILEENLQDRNLFFDVELIVDTIMVRPKFSTMPRYTADSLGFINTRPMLVSPSKNEYLKARFEPPVLFILTKMFWQIVVAVLLIFGIVGTFCYLFWTINRQNKLALLRKSFVNNMTHELKTPVATVMAAVEAIQRYRAKDDKLKMERYLQISQQELSHLANLIEKVLQLDIDELHGLSLEVKEFDIIALMREVIELSKLGAKKSIDFELSVQENVILVVADYSHLKNVFTNLIDNAIKYSHEEVAIKVKFYQESDKICVEIEDNGLGIARVYLGDIFEMFFRVPNGNLHPVKGFGLGLAYVKQVVDQHKGSIAVESDLNIGTKFIIKLPKAIA